MPFLVILVKIAPHRSCPLEPRRSCAGRNLAPRRHGCHVERSRNISRGTSAYPRRSPERVRASPFSFPYAALDPRAILVKIAPHRSCPLPRRSCAGRNLAPPVVMLSGAETSLGERRRTQDARQRESAPPHFHPLTRPDEAPGHSCENSAPSFLPPAPSFLRRQEPRPPGCHVERSRNISRGTSAYPRRSPERVRASPFSSSYAARRGPGPFLRRQGPRSHPHPVHPREPGSVTSAPFVVARDPVRWLHDRLVGSTHKPDLWFAAAAGLPPLPLGEGWGERGSSAQTLFSMRPLVSWSREAGRGLGNAPDQGDQGVQIGYSVHS